MRSPPSLGVGRSGSETFITQPFTGVRPDVLKRCESESVVRSENAKVYREGIERSRKKEVSSQDSLVPRPHATRPGYEATARIALQQVV